MRVHLGTRACLERLHPEMKAQREEVARRAKLAYDRVYSKARGETIQDLGMRVLTQQHENGSVAPASILPERLLPQPPLQDSEVDGPRQASPPRCRLGAQRSEREVIDLTHESDEAYEAHAVCPICMGTHLRPVLVP
ncbi:hypothetical protein PHYPSEUDO_006947 [Phytophthora pseudosyringae]|uniref:Uncharacterized protein n=1 Tax=Phytophthora pseudosyringae TaxID=221518 RepID=A0A8T1VHH2_9STRA|nr:hypothetical protein PHYPSEUDO_006947 [Phytophthora pseudosyringae]